MIKIKIILVLLVALVLSTNVLAQTTGQFEIENVPPEIVANSFAVRDGPNAATDWDSTVIIDTHDAETKMRWQVNDPNGNPVTTRVCVSSTASRLCDLVDFTTAAGVITYTVAPGVLTYSGTSKTYYADLTPNDGTVNGATLSTSFNLINSIPTALSGLTISPLGPPGIPMGVQDPKTHDQTPTILWTASTDADIGTVDRWPADTITYYVTVGSSPGLAEWFSGSTTLTSVDVASPGVPWGTSINNAWSNKLAYIRIRAEDGKGGVSGNSDLQFSLLDWLSDIVDIKIADSGAPTGCKSPSTCILNPTRGTTTSVVAELSVQDQDNDCNALDYPAQTFRLCLSTTGCTPTTTPWYDFTLAYNRIESGLCYFTVSSASGGPEFWRLPNTQYKLYIIALSQSGQKSASGDPEQVLSWTYNELSASDYVALVILGDTPIDLNAWNPGINEYIMTNFGNKILTVRWAATDPTSGTNTWDLGVAGFPDFQVDDDSSQGEATETGLTPGNIQNSPLVTFNPTGGLQICTQNDCLAPPNTKLPTRFHIRPPTGLAAGIYTTIIDIQLT